MTIKYTEEFKTKCFNYLRHFMDIRLLTSAMDNGREEVVRYYSEKALDDAERKIANAKIYAHAQRQELYNEYMELLTKTLDKENVRSKLLRK